MTTFNPNSITPPERLFLKWQRDQIRTTRAIVTRAARWGARQAVEALRHEWPMPLTVPVTKADADRQGNVQVWLQNNNCYALCHWQNVCDRPWLHTAGWQPKSEPTPKAKALNILRDATARATGCVWLGPDNVKELREALLALPGDEE